MKISSNAYEYRDGWLWWVRHHHKSNVGQRVGHKRSSGYWYYGNRLVHLLIWELHYGPVPDGMLVDHEDRNLDNCAITNLRLVTPSQSSANRGRMKDRDLPVGVRRYGKKYRAYIDSRHLGTFASADEAWACRKENGTEYHASAQLDWS